MLRLMSGYFVTQAIRCAAELRLADELEGGPKSAEELAEAAGCSVPHLRRLLEALAGVGVFTRSNGRFALTALGDFIRYGRPDGLWPVASLFGDEMYEALMALTSSVRSGRLATSSRVGASLWDYFAAHPERGRVFDEALGALGRDEVAAIVEAYDFSAAHTVVDVGGGNGALLRAILERHAHARGVLFETPGVVDRSERSSDDSGRLARCDRARGDFFAEIVPGGDIYVLKHVLHDWSDEDALRILRSCRAALSARARLLIIEIFLDRPSAYRPADWMSLGIMTAFGGKERTSAELHELCVAAGLAPGRVISTDSPASIMEAQRA
jgi:hypothetical protein